MGKVIVNEQDAKETAGNSESVEKKQPEEDSVPVERALVRPSRNLAVAESAGAGMSAELKDGVKKEKTIAVASGEAKVEKKTIAVKEPESRLKNAKKSEDEVKKPVTQVKILESTQVAHAPKKVAVDPEVALMESRAVTAEKSRDDAVKLQKQMGGRVMSDMVRRPVMHGGQRVVATGAKSEDGVASEEESAFSKMKSALIGVGVAVVVAVIGFVCIGIFGNSKSMCVVQFESNGGTPVEGTEIVCGKTVSQPDEPTKEGFTFQGWMQDGDLFDFDETPLYKNAILVARWQANEGTEIVKVKFDTDGGSKMDEVEIAKGAKLHISIVPTKMGYVFDDWYLDGKPFDFDEPVTRDIILKATWTKRQVTTNNNTNNSNSGSNSEKPAAVKVASMSANGMTIGKVGDTGSVAVSIVPSAAEYSLEVVSSNDNVSCSITDKNKVTCKANKYGETKVRVRDANSGVNTTFTVVVDKPEIEEPEEPKPENPEEPPVETPSYTLTINYVDGDGKVIATSHTSTVEKGKDYTVSSPVIEGYTTTETTVSGTMGDGNKTVTVTYTPVVTPTPDPTPEPTPDPAPDTTN